MTNARNAILARLKKKTKTTDSAPIRLKVKHNEALKPKDTVAILIKKLVENRAEVHQVNAKNWTHTLAKIATQNQLKSWLIGSGLHEIEQASHALSAASPEVSLVHYTHNYETLKRTLFHDVEASFTLAKAAIAETGTLVLVPDINEPRMMSLVPPVHVVLIKESDVLNNFQTLANAPVWSNKIMPSNILFISSPSKTADIQQTLAYGAHGPKRLIVLILNETH